MEPFLEETRRLLLCVSTATLSTILFKRGFRNVYLRGVHPLAPTAPRVAGPASTLRYIPASEDLDHLGAFEDFVEHRIAKGASIFGLYPSTDEVRRDFDDWRRTAGKPSRSEATD